MNEEANNKIRTNNKDGNKIKEKLSMDSKRNVTGKISYEREQINFDSNNTKKDNNKEDSEKEKSGKKSSIFTQGDFQININNNDNNISKTSNNIESDIFDNFMSRYRNNGNSPLFSEIEMVRESNNINNTGREIYNHYKSLNVEESENINSQSNKNKINNNKDNKNKSINNNNKKTINNTG